MEDRDLQVGVWRAEFQKERKRLGRYWRSLLMNSTDEFNNDAGRRMMESVNDKRANLIRTVTVVRALRKIKTPAAVNGKTMSAAR